MPSSRPPQAVRREGDGGDDDDALNLYGVSGALEDTVQGIIIIAAVAFASYRLRGAR